MFFVATGPKLTLACNKPLPRSFQLADIHGRHIADVENTFLERVIHETTLEMSRHLRQHLIIGVIAPRSGPMLFLYHQDTPLGTCRENR